MDVHLLWRSDACQYWALELPVSAPIGKYSSPCKDIVVNRGGYLLRGDSIVDDTLVLSGYINTTTSLGVIPTLNDRIRGVIFDGGSLGTSQSDIGKLSASSRSLPVRMEIPRLSAGAPFGVR